MASKILAASCLVATAAAYAPMMSMELGRRQVVQTGAAAAAVAPFLRGSPASATFDKSAKAPVITIFDHRGCKRGAPDAEYKGVCRDRPSLGSSLLLAALQLFRPLL